MTKKFKIISFIMIIAMIIFVINLDAFKLLLAGDIEAIKASEDGLYLLLFVTLILMVIQNLVTIIPLILLVSINVALYGFVNGFIWSWLTSLVGAVICFLVARFWFQDLLRKRIAEKIHKKIEKNGLVFVFIARVFPFVPTSIINIAAGVSSIRFKHYLISTVIGNMIYLFAMALIPLGLMSVDIESYVYYVTIALGIMGFVVYKLYRKKHPKNKATV